ncbi:hypothetical protein Mapa_000918 [Marchantia paleacea]|nr:hypothetical protein Mapa_000918 [Marchantia paleacea]
MKCAASMTLLAFDAAMVSVLVMIHELQFDITADGSGRTSKPCFSSDRACN